MDTKLNPRRNSPPTDPLAPVRLSPVRVNGSRVEHRAVEIQNDEGTWEVLNIHSPVYQLIPNEVMASVTRDILAESQLDWRPRGSVWTGRYYAELFASDGLVEVPEVGDTIALGLRSENSYDGSCQFRIVLQAWVLSCSNGLVSPRTFTSFALRHMAGNEFEIDRAVRTISEGLPLLEAVAPRVAALSRTPLSINLLARIARQIHLPAREWGYITPSLDGVSDLWGLMQVITHRLTHHGRGRAGLLQQERVGDYFLDKMATA